MSGDVQRPRWRVWQYIVPRPGHDMLTWSGLPSKSQFFDASKSPVSHTTRTIYVDPVIGLSYMVGEDAPGVVRRSATNVVLSSAVVGHDEAYGR